MTVAKAVTRESASMQAADAYQGLRDAQDETPTQCRVVSAAQLVREGGEGELRAAAAEIARRPLHHFSPWPRPASFPQ